MKKLFLFSLTILLSFSAIGQSTVLDTALVSAARLKTTLQSSNRNVVVISGEELRSAPVQNVAELLDFAVGVDARQRGIFGTQTDLSVRGGTYEQVLVLLNGVRLSDPQTGHHLMNLPVSLSEIERIEVLLGGGSYIFGGSAFSGAVNIITKQAEKNQTNLQAVYGSFNTYQLGASQRLKGKKHRTLFSVKHTASDGFKTNTDFDHTNLFARSNISLGENTELNLDAGYTQQAFGAQGFYSANFPEQHEKTKTLFAGAGLQTRGRINFNNQVYWRRNWDEFQLFREGDGFYRYDNGLFIKGTDTAGTWYTSHNYHLSDVLGVKSEASFSSGLGRTNVGVEYRLENILSNNLGEPLDERIEIDGSRGFYSLSAQRHNLSLAAEHVKSFGKFDISAAALVNYNSDYSTDIYPAVTAGFRIGKDQKIYASFNESFRLPSYTDLYYRLGGAVGSKDLLPEQSVNLEAGYKMVRSKFLFNASVFKRNGKNLIDWVQYCDTCDLLASNVSEVNFTGAEFSIKLRQYKWMNALKLNFVELGYSYLATEGTQPDFRSLYVFDYLRNKVVLKASHGFGNLNWSYGLSFQDRNGDYHDAVTGQSTPYPDVWLINTRLGYRWSAFNFFAEAQNLLNKRYYDRGNVELPGLWVRVGAEVSF